MARDWPARDVAPLIALIDDPRHALDADGTYRLSDEQARAILDLRLQRLTALGRDEIADELEQARRRDRRLSRHPALARARPEHHQGRARRRSRREFATPRRTEIVDQDGEIEDEDLIQREDMVVTVTHAGYIKRVPLSTYRAQRRGGKGRAGMQTREEDFVTRLFVASTHTPVLFFSSRGQVYKEKVWRLPLAAPQARGKALINLLPLEQGERITTIMPLPEDEASWETLDVMFATTRGTVRRNKLSDFVDVRRSGMIAMKLDEGEAHRRRADLHRERRRAADHRAAASASASRSTTCACSRAATRWACAASRSAEGDKVISLSILRHVEATADERAAYLKRAAPCGAAARARPRRRRSPTHEEADGADRARRSSAMSRCRRPSSSSSPISENGYGKRTSSFEYRITGRGGKGIVAMAVTERNGRLVASFPVEESDQIMLVTDGGQLIRCPVDGIRIAGRATQGVIVFKTAEGEQVVSVERLSEEGEENGQ